MNSISDVRWKLHERSAVWAYQRFQFAYPELVSILHGADGRYEIHVTGHVEDWEELCRRFDSEIRPASANVKLVSDLPSTGRVDIPATAADDAWLINEPMTHPWINDLLSLAAPNLPAGNLVFKFELDGFFFEHQGLSNEELACVDAAYRKLKLPGSLRFAQLPASLPEEKAAPASVMSEDFLDLPVVRRFRGSSQAIRRLVEEDEDSWRKFADSRGEMRRYKSESSREKFSVLFGADDLSEVKLSELLCIYDVINIVPTYDLEWLGRHEINLGSFEELVGMGRVKLVLPVPVARYPSSLVEAAVGADSSSVILSRRLASLTVSHGQHKDPLLYGPFSNQERIDFLRVIQSVGSSTPLAPLVSAYGRVLRQQHTALFRRGAVATMEFGFGALIGDLVHATRGIDARLELSQAGAMVEWAACLGATYLPREFGDYDESRNATIIANYFNRTVGSTSGNVADRMHRVVDGLLAPRGLSPLDVARGTTAESFWKFRRLASGLLTSNVDQQELSQLVSKLNDDVSSFERRREFQARYHITTTLAELAAFPLNGKIDLLFPGASILAASLARICKTMLKERGVFPSDDGPWGDVVDAMHGLATWTSLDAVVVSRARDSLAK
ncbi:MULTISPECIES: hypothetical protein [Xanthomonas translucens group]|uniref:hypothetical protein n=1 Tax=Xanthomonas translucens group TaxID=3390202 RepID=UPI000579689D|nr:hypothetical protein [Xanthomonas translucens]UKE46240.1 hypothetical protein KHA79_14050 [Xanthomonas translucens pv. cerealis]